VRYYSIILLTLSLLIPSEAKSQSIWKIRTDDSVVINESAPMIGQYKAPAIYHRWSREIAQCEGFKPLPDSLVDLIAYFEVNARDFQINLDQTTYFAVTVPPEGIMYIAMARLFDEWIVKHEFLHIYMWLNGYAKEGHNHDPRWYQKSECHITPN